MALAMTGLAYFSAEAQETDGKKNCEVIQNVVCSKGHDCYKTQYAENFKVCKNDHGYFICCETAEYNNSTHPLYVVVNNENPNYNVQNSNMQENGVLDENVVMTDKAPQSQSYPGYFVVSDGANGGYYFQKGKIKACYGGNNVAELNRAPYHGCPSPQYDGPEKNLERNLNVVDR